MPVYSTDSGDLRKVNSAKSAQIAPNAKSGPARVLLDAKGRRGKVVTLVTNLQHNPQHIAEIARKLKTSCGAGGTVEGHDILIQGDHREKITRTLSEMGFAVKAG